MGAECGKRIRLGRVLDPKSGRAVVVAFDHGLDNGPMRGNGNPRAAIARLVEGGADALLVSPGIARLCGDLFVGKTAPGLIVRLDWSNTFRATERLGFEEGRTRLIADVDDAARLGADAVLTYLLIGYSDPDVEADEVAKNARVSRACERLGIPHVMEPMARGDRARGRELDVGLIKVHARIAAELGADAIKTNYGDGQRSYADVIDACPIPVLIAGGRQTAARESLAMVYGALTAGAVGVVFGRNITQADDPARMLRAVRALVHEGRDVEEALQYLL